jgi:hypothetical protein
MAQRIKNALAARVTDMRRDFWKVGTVPYNAAVMLLTTAVMVQSRAWLIREEA